ncbi:MAG: hypothetical protein RIF32_00680 [Leptospirales bacterium]
MRKYFWLIGGLLVFFAFAAQAIIGVKLLELRSRIQRDRILNLELSSQALQARSRRLASSRRDFRSEIRQSVIESGLLNHEQPKPLRLSVDQFAGLGAINAARVLALKPLLFLFADYEALLLMRYAFYLERNRRYSAAIERYKELAGRPGRGLPDEMRAFVSLHLAYCQASTGEKIRAITGLQRVQREHPGTHYSRAASILLHVLQDGLRRSARLAREDLSQLERGRRLMQMGQCSDALLAFEKHRDLLNQKAAVAVPLGPMDTYRESLCFEETGQIRRAIVGYQNVVRETRDRQAAVLANRRLLIVGNFYAGDSRALARATDDARRLGDTQALQEITAVAREQKAPLVIQEIREHSGVGADSQDPEASRILAGMRAEVLTEIGPVIAHARTQKSRSISPSAAVASGDEIARGYPAPGALMLPELATAVSGGSTEVRIVSGAWLRTTRIERLASGELLLSGAGVLQALAPREVLEIRPAPIAPGRGGVLEIGLRDGRVVYARALRRVTAGGPGPARFRWVMPLGSDGGPLAPAPAIQNLRFLRTP